MPLLYINNHFIELEHFKRLLSQAVPHISRPLQVLILQYLHDTSLLSAHLVHCDSFPHFQCFWCLKVLHAAPEFVGPSPLGFFLETEFILWCQTCGFWSCRECFFRRTPSFWRHQFSSRFLASGRRSIFHLLPQECPTHFRSFSIPAF